MNTIVLEGAYGNNDWEQLAFLREDEADHCDPVMKEFIKSFGNGWNFRWSRT